VRRPFGTREWGLHRVTVLHTELAKDSDDELLLIEHEDVFRAETGDSAAKYPLGVTGIGDGEFVVDFRRRTVGFRLGV